MALKIPDKLFIVEDESLRKSRRKNSISGKGQTIPEGRTHDLIAIVKALIEGATSQGISAYQVWLDLGNTGTPSDYQVWLRGTDGDNGQGVPPGGDAGQVLAKTTSQDYETQWVPSTGVLGNGLLKKSQTLTIANSNCIVSVHTLEPNNNNNVSGSYADGVLTITIGAGTSFQSLSIYMPASEATYDEGIFNQAFKISLIEIGSSGDLKRNVSVNDGTNYNAGSGSDSGYMSETTRNIPTYVQRVSGSYSFVLDRIKQIHSHSALISIN